MSGDAEYMGGILPLVLDEWNQKSKSLIYRRDPEAWAADILGARWWSKQQEIAQSYVDNRRTAVKSANSTGKSHLVADLICHWVSVYPPEEVLAIITAPTLDQIERVVFAYLKERYNYTLRRSTEMNNKSLMLPGSINEQLEWKYNMQAGRGFLAFGKRPADKDIISTFQGTRKRRTAVFLDEAGGVPEDMFDAAEAVLNGEDDYVRFMAIGNPDNRGTYFHRIYTDPKLEGLWNLFTISAFDLPTITGEKVFDDPMEQAAKFGQMTGKTFIKEKQQSWGENSARYQAKVLGEFPSDDDNAFFPQETIDRALDTKLSEDDIFDLPVFLGVDVALKGQDESSAYLNRGGKIRRVDAWSKSNHYENAKRIHALAREYDVDEVRVDAAGTSSGTFSDLENLSEFQDRNYVLYGILGSNSSPNPNLWSRARSWHYDQFREGMFKGTIDLDRDDRELYDELISQTYKYSNRNALQITPKAEMKKAGLKSPDHLDAAIYSYIDMSTLSDNPLSGMRPGDVVSLDPDDFLDWNAGSEGYPM